MAGIPQLQKQFLDYAASLFNEETLTEQFIRVHKLKPAHNPNFTTTMIAIFFEGSSKLINTMSELLDQPMVDFTAVYHTAQTLRGSSATVGAGKIKKICSHFRNFCDSCNTEMVKRVVRQLHYHNSLLKSKLDNFFMLENQIQNAGGVIPPLELERNGYGLENAGRM
uniref:Histidine-containing phosphotransfer protein n=1 Tax=Kalanchoe fedtschenkoi TaxID=63787 RepID=A0A7N0ZTD4_KALFE